MLLAMLECTMQRLRLVAYNIMLLGLLAGNPQCWIVSVGQMGQVTP
jgi:hypothetical protein